VTVGPRSSGLFELAVNHFVEVRVALGEKVEKLRQSLAQRNWVLMVPHSIDLMQRCFWSRIDQNNKEPFVLLGASGGIVASSEHPQTRVRVYEG